MNAVKTLYSHFEEYMATACVALMILCLFIQVAVRIISGSALAWTEELSRYSFIWAVYLGAALAAKRAAHVRITAQFIKMPIPARLFFRILADIIWIAGCIYVAVQGLDVIQDGLAFPETSPTLGVTKAWIETIIPISFIMVAWRILENYIVHIKHNKLLDMVNYEESTT